jgi:hypothetical protein
MTARAVIVRAETAQGDRSAWMCTHLGFYDPGLFGPRTAPTHRRPGRT